MLPCYCQLGLLNQTVGEGGQGTAAGDACLLPLLGLHLPTLLLLGLHPPPDLLLLGDAVRTRPSVRHRVTATAIATWPRVV